MQRNNTLLATILTLIMLSAAVSAFAKGKDRVPNVKMADGREMPQFGLGAFHLGQPSTAKRVLSAAIRHGYRHFDLSHAWANAEALGSAIAESGTARSNFWVSVAINANDFKDKTICSVVDSLVEASGMQYFDILYLIDINDGNIIDDWREMGRLDKCEAVKAIGLSDFNGDIRVIDDICNTGIMPAAVQIISAPYAPMPDWLQRLSDQGIATVCVIPLLGDPLDMELFSDPLVGVVANHHNKTPMQVVLKWHLQQGMTVVAGSCQLEDLAQLIGLFDFQLSPAEYESMALVASSIKPTPFLLEQLKKLIDGYLLFTY